MAHFFRTHDIRGTAPAPGVLGIELKPWWNEQCGDHSHDYTHYFHHGSTYQKIRYPTLAELLFKSRSNPRGWSGNVKWC